MITRVDNVRRDRLSTSVSSHEATVRFCHRRSHTLHHISRPRCRQIISLLKCKHVHLTYIWCKHYSKYCFNSAQPPSINLLANIVSTSRFHQSVRNRNCHHPYELIPICACCHFNRKKGIYRPVITISTSYGTLNFEIVGLIVVVPVYCMMDSILTGAWKCIRT